MNKIAKTLKILVTQNINETVAVTRARRTKVSFMKTADNVFLSQMYRKRFIYDHPTFLITVFSYTFI